MAIAFRASAQDTTQTSATLSFTDPGTAGDYELLFVELDFSGGSGWTAPTGWTPLFANDQLSAVDGATIGVFYIASAVGGGATVTINIPSGPFSHACGVILAFSGADSAVVPVSGHQVADSANSDPWGVTCPAVTANAAGGYWVAAAVLDPNTSLGTNIFVGPNVGSFTDRIDVTDSSNWNALSVAYGSPVTGSASSGTTVITCTRGGSASAAFVGYSVLLTPAASAATPPLDRRRTTAQQATWAIEDDPIFRRRLGRAVPAAAAAVYARRPQPIASWEPEPDPWRARRLPSPPAGPPPFTSYTAPELAAIPLAWQEEPHPIFRRVSLPPPTPPVTPTAIPRRDLTATFAWSEEPPSRIQARTQPFPLAQGAPVYARLRPPPTAWWTPDDDVPRRPGATIPAAPAVVPVIMTRTPLVAQLWEADTDSPRRRVAVVPPAGPGAAFLLRAPPAQAPFLPTEDEMPTRRRVLVPPAPAAVPPTLSGPRVPVAALLLEETDALRPRRLLIPTAPAQVPVFAKLPPGKSPPPEDEFFPLPRRRLPFPLVQGAAVYARPRFRLPVDDDPLIILPRVRIIPPPPAAVPVAMPRRRQPQSDDDGPFVVRRPVTSLVVIPFTGLPPFVARFIDTNYPQAVADLSAYELAVEDLSAYPLEVVGMKPRKVGDTAYPIAVQLTGAGVPISLAGATVTFSMRSAETGVKVSGGACTITDSANGLVNYQPIAADVDTSGDFQCEFRVTTAGGAKVHFPTGFETLTLLESIT